jgi:hypothetical protein
MNAYLWHAGGPVAHHIRARSIEEVRERIAVTHGTDTAQRAVIKAIVERTDPEPAAAA